MELSALAESAMKGAERVGRGFRSPSDDWAPIAIAVKPNGENLIADLSAGRFTTEEMFKEVVPQSIRHYSFSKIALVLSTWVAEAPSDDDLEQMKAGGISSLPRDKRNEMLLVVAVEPYESLVFTAKIARFPDDPPILGAWAESDLAMSWIVESITDALREV